MILYLTLVCLPGCDDPKACFPLGVDDNEEPACGVAVEAEALFSIVAAGVGPVDRLRIEEGLGGKAEVETTGVEDLFSLVVILFKLKLM